MEEEEERVKKREGESTHEWACVSVCTCAHVCVFEAGIYEEIQAFWP